MRLFSLVSANQGEPGEPVSSFLCSSSSSVLTFIIFCSTKGSPGANWTGWHPRTWRKTWRARRSRYTRTTSKHQFDFCVHRLICCFPGTSRPTGRERWHRTYRGACKLPFTYGKVFTINFTFDYRDRRATQVKRATVATQPHWTAINSRLESSKDRQDHQVSLSNIHDTIKTLVISVNSYFLPSCS